MTPTEEKVYNLKEEIYQLYSVEGRCVSYISRELGLNRKYLTHFINNVFCFEKMIVRIPTERVKNLIELHREAILHYCDSSEEFWISPLRDQLNITESELVTIRVNDTVIDKAITNFLSKPTLASIARDKRVIKEKLWAEEMKDLEGEVWRDIVGYEGRYKISNLGRVSNNAKILAIQFNPRIGRNQIGLSTNGRTKAFKPYRLIAEAFLPNPDNLPTVNHKDGDCTNDVLENLEWSSYKEQNHHRVHVLGRGVAKAYKKNGKFKEVLVEGKHIFKTLKAVADYLGVSQTTIQRYLSGETPSPVSIELIF